MRIGLVAYLVLVLMVMIVGVPPAQAANPKAPTAATKEPERFAFVVGNSQYQLHFSTLGDLPDVCDEAVSFRANLLAMGWRADHIYPLVTSPPAEKNADDAIKSAICDLTGHELQRQLRTFIGQILTNQNNPYAVVFYAGHGSESNDQFYAFGVDAIVKPNEELQLLRQSTDYEVFSRDPTLNSEGPTGVNLTHLVAPVNGPNGKALLMIIDACRDDPVLDAFNASRTDPMALSQEERRRLSMSYIASPSDSYDELFRNIIVMFAGRPGKPVSSGGASRPDWFSQHLFSYMG